MAQSNDNDPQRPLRIKASYEKLASGLDYLQKHHTSEAQKYGWARDLCEDYAVQFKKITDYPSLADTENALTKFKEFVQGQIKQVTSESIDISSAAFVISTGTAVSSYSAFPSSPSSATLTMAEPPTWHTAEKTRLYSEALENYRPGLGHLLLAVWESFNGSTYEGERAALMHMRELFNQFFELIAPDEHVRNSSFFTSKSGAKPQEIYRRERLKYAANTKIENKQLCKLLDSEIDVVLAAYENLNSLHKRGKLDRGDTRKSLTAIQLYLQQWIDALNSSK
jgi:hypothetical protein